MKQEEIKKLHNGLISCPLNKVRLLMPEVWPIVSSCPLPHVSYVVDVKVHMLMPGQYPCIPNWHGDFIPRDGDGNLMPEYINDYDRMFLWLSGPPITEFKDGREVKPQEWVEFGQGDIHRGCVSDDFQWRLFIRLAPEWLVRNDPSSYLRRHTQVYLDAGNFTW